MIRISVKTLAGIFFLTALFFPGASTAFAQKDSSFYCKSFNTVRYYRIYLPADYDSNPEKRYPVVYYFHGWSGRYKWDYYDVTEDPYYPGNGRKHPPFVMEWLDYSQHHDVIIVTWDGYEPNLHPGEFVREGIRYGYCQPYDYPRAHEKNPVQWGWDYKMQFRELVAHIDSAYRTIADRDHRAITGLSMGGLTSLYITGQNKDLVSSASAFCPADNIPMYGPKGYLAVFPVLEMYRSLKGVDMRLSFNDGDWLHANDILMKRIFEGSGFTPFEYHEAHFPDHWAADTREQLDFHMAEFQKTHPRPDNWSHICPAFKTFDQWGYTFTIERDDPALTLLENMSKKHLKVFARKFIPDGPVVTDETIHVVTDSLYNPETAYTLIKYNLAGETFSSGEGISTNDGRLEFTLPGGGNIVGIHTEDMADGPDLMIINKMNRDYLYFETGKVYSLGFTLVNVGNRDAENVTVRVMSDHPHIVFNDDEISIPSVAPAAQVKIDSAFRFAFSGYDEENLAGNLRLEVSINGVVADTQKIVFFVTPVSPYIPREDYIVLDGRTTESAVPVFNQGSNSVRKSYLSGGTGNGNGIPEKGEDVLVYIRLKQGLSPNDKNTFHKTCLIGDYDNPYVSVKKLKYDEKMDQAGATSISTFVSISDSIPDSVAPALWFRVESLYNNSNVPASRRTTYEFSYDYRRLIFPSKDSDTSNTGYLIPEGNGMKLEQNYPNPVTRQTNIGFSLETADHITLNIFDLHGHKIKELVNEMKVPGKYSVTWDGTDEQHKRCDAGIYLYRLATLNKVLVKRMVLL